MASFHWKPRGKHINKQTNTVPDRGEIIEQAKTDSMYSVNVIYLLSNNKKLIETLPLCPHLFWFSCLLVFGMEYTYYGWILIISVSVEWNQEH